ncbi:MAG: hypothetical protein AAGI71_19330 [Bacteroidota bacterium]
MPWSKHDIRRDTASILLIVYLLGGLFAPALHRVHHGHVQAHHFAEVPAAPCHHGHDSEAPASDHEEDCSLCDHQLHFSDAQATPLFMDRAYSDYVQPQRLAPDAPLFFYVSVRGPPSHT